MCALLSLNPGLKNCAGAEVQLQADGSYTVRWLRLSMDKQLIQIGTKKLYEGTLEQILKRVAIEPLALCLTGKGVLIKKTSRLDVVSESTLQHLFPAMQLADFYVQHFASGEHSFVSIIRKETANAVLDAFKKQGMEVLILSLGAFVVDQVLPQINSYEGVLKFDGHQVLLDAEKNWKEYNYLPTVKAAFPIKVEMEQLPEEFLLAYATAFQLILNDKLSLVEVEDEELQGRLIELIAKLKFNTHGTVMLLGLFLLLMLNFFLFSNYNSSNEQLMNKAGQQSYIYENRQKLETEVKEKESQVKKLGWNGGYPYAYLCDQIAVSLPKELNLDELQINQPTRSMSIKGRTSSVYAINDWIYGLRQKSWVKDVQIQKYAAEDQKETQVFTIRLTF